MLLLIGLESPVELDGCDCAVVEVNKAFLEKWERQAQILITAHSSDSSVYKIDFWGNSLDVYSCRLQEALEAYAPESMANFDDGLAPVMIPKDFDFPEPEEGNPARLDLRMTEVVQPNCWDEVDEVEFQFSACVKHTDCGELRTHPVTLEQLKEWLSG